MFFWYTYQISTYYSDIKIGAKNIYNEENYVQKDFEKREYFYQ
jgi:hypothetical protein